MAQGLLGQLTDRYDQDRKYRSLTQHRGNAKIPAPRRELMVDLTTFFKGHVRGLKVKENGYAWGHCPFHNDHNPSFSVNLRTGRYQCMSSSCGVAGRGLVSFVACRYGLSVQEAREYLEAWA